MPIQDTALSGDRVEITGAAGPQFDEILTPEAIAFVAKLQREFGSARAELLASRGERQREIDAGGLPEFPGATAAVRNDDWRIAPVPTELNDRRVEITGPTDRKIVINALNSGARAFMADLEDAGSPTWANMVGGQVNLRDAVMRTISFESEGGKRYALTEAPAVLMVRPRGWHLIERHMRVDGKPVAGGLFDFGLYFFHNARALLEHGSGPYFYLPKLENHLEARLWNDVFEAAQDELGIARGTIKATVLIEHILAAFEADEILYELRDHSAGLNCGRWDYIFSFIKTFRNRPDFVLPDRAQIAMTTPFMQSYVRHVIKTCHRRGAHAMGGMAAQIPIKSDPVANETALAKVRADKIREVQEGHDGTWVAHPGLVPIAMDVFDQHMPRPNQVDRQRPDVDVRAADLLEVPEGSITETGLRTNINVGVLYLESWLRGKGCVPLYHLMEDAATAEISRTQVWQWIRHDRGRLDDGRTVNEKLFRELMSEELQNIREHVGVERFDRGRFAEAADIFGRLSTAEELAEFLTTAAYDELD